MNKIHLYDKILSPIVTEKSTSLSDQNKIVFKVPDNANKKNLKKNIEKIFKVNVTKINIINKKSIGITLFTRCLGFIQGILPISTISSFISFHKAQKQQSCNCY